MHADDLIVLITLNRCWDIVIRFIHIDWLPDQESRLIVLLTKDPHSERGGCEHCRWHAKCWRLVWLTCWKHLLRWWWWCCWCINLDVAKREFSEVADSVLFGLWLWHWDVNYPRLAIASSKKLSSCPPTYTRILNRREQLLAHSCGLLKDNGEDSNKIK